MILHLSAGIGMGGHHASRVALVRDTINGSVREMSQKY